MSASAKEVKKTEHNLFSAKKAASLFVGTSNTDYSMFCEKDVRVRDNKVNPSQMKTCLLSILPRLRLAAKQ